MAAVAREVRPRAHLVRAVLRHPQARLVPRPQPARHRGRRPRTEALLVALQQSPPHIARIVPRPVAQRPQPPLLPAVRQPVAVAVRIDVLGRQRALELRPLRVGERPVVDQDLRNLAGEAVAAARPVAHRQRRHRIPHRRGHRARALRRPVQVARGHRPALDHAEHLHPPRRGPQDRAGLPAALRPVHPPQLVLVGAAPRLPQHEAAARVRAQVHQRAVRLLRGPRRRHHDHRHIVAARLRVHRRRRRQKTRAIKGHRRLPVQRPGRPQRLPRGRALEHTHTTPRHVQPLRDIIRGIVRDATISA